MIKKYSAWLIRNRIRVIAVSLLICFIAAIGVTRLKISTDFRVYLDDNSQDVLNIERIEDKFTKNETLYIALKPTSGTVFEKNTVTALLQLTQKLWETPHSVRVDSLSNFQFSKAIEDDISVENLIPEKLDSSYDFAQLKKIALAEPLLKKSLLSEDGLSTGLLVTLHLSDDLPERMTQTPQAVSFVRQVIAQYQERYPNIHFYLAGSIMMNQVMGEAAVQDILTLVPLCYAIITLLLFLLLRNIWAVAITLFIVSLVNILVLGIYGWLDSILAPVIGFVPSAILIIAIADCIHILSTYYKNLQSGQNKEAAISNSLKINFMPVTVTSFTTIVGFLCLNFNDSPPYRDLGNMVATGTLAAFLLSVFLLPALLAVLPVAKNIKKPLLNKLMEKLGRHVSRSYRYYLPACLCITSLFAYQMFNNKLNDNWNNYFDLSFDLRIATEKINEEITGLHRIDYMLTSKYDGGISHPEFLIFVESFKVWYQQQSNVAHSSAITDIFKRLNKNMHFDQELAYKLPENTDLASQYLLFYEMSLPYGLGLNNQVSFNKSATRVSITVYKTSSEEVLILAQKAQNWLQDNTPDSIQVSSASGLDIAFANIARSNTNSMLWGTLLAFFVISIMLGCITRSIKYGVISLIPNILPAICAFGVWGLTISEIGLATSAVVSMAIGIIVDDTVHFLTKYKFARESLNLSPEAAIEYAFSTVGIAMVITTVVLVAGFVIMGFSPFQPTAHMGNLLALTIFTALIIDLLFLPSILLYIDKKDSERTVNTLQEGYNHG
ncbi:MAG: MMPL family transporter [Colwellia sp.]|nr:MMPL family transporter [Colwellia sp.]